MKTKLSKILFGIMFALLVVAGGGLFGACKKSSGKVEPDMPKEPSVVYDGDILPLEVEDGTLLRYTGEQNAVIEIPATYSIDEYGNIVVGDTYQITKIADEAFKGVKFFDAYIDMSNVTEIGDSAFKEVRNLTVSEMPKLNVVKDYAFYKAAVNFKNGDLQKVTYFGAYSFAESKGYEMPANSSLQTVHAEDIDTQSGNLRIGGNNTITSVSAGSFANSSTYSGYGLIFGSGIVTVHSDGAFSNMGITSVNFTGGTYNLTTECFAENTNLTKVTMKGNFGDTTGESFKYAFADCTSLVAVNLPRTGITGIRSDTFAGCTGLTEITRSATEATSGGVINFQFAPAENCGYTSFGVPQSIEEIDGGAFRGFGKLRSIGLCFVGRNAGVATNNTNGEGHFGYIFGSISFEGATQTTQNTSNWYIPDSLTSIGLTMERDKTTAWAFMNMTHLNNVSITSGSVTFTTLMGSTFKGCTGLAYVSLPNTTTSFGGEVFNGCTSLQNITLPSSLSSIGASAFENCTSLKSITLPSSLSGNNSFPYHYDASGTESNLFKNCTSLVAVNIPNTIKGQNMNDTTMFAGCTGLTKITRSITEATSGGVINFYYPDNVQNAATTSFRIPASITTIDNNAFKNWTGLQYLNLCSGGVVESFGIDACRGCSALVKVTFSTSLKTLGNNCFYGCSKLGNHSTQKYLTFSSGLTTIGTNCFNGCSYLQAVNIPSTLTTLGSGAFTGCTLLTSWTRNATAQTSGGVINFQFSESTACALSGALYISGPVTSLGANCFQNFTSITSVTIPSAITTFGNYVFRSCTSLTSATFASGRTTISAYGIFYNCSALSSVTFPSSGLTSISGTYMFSGCSSLATVTIPSTVTTLGGYLFASCTGLQYITIPNRVTTISGDCLFDNCSNLEAVNIPGTISSGLGDTEMFAGCTKLTKTCRNSTSVTSGGYINFMAANTNTSATTVCLSTSVTKIGESTFSGWTSLRTVDNVSNVEYIGDYAFYNCTSLYSSWISDMTKLKEIGDGYYGETFQGCSSSNFTSITLPSGFTTLNRYAFYGCTNLDTVKVPSSIKYIYEYCFVNTRMTSGAPSWGFDYSSGLIFNFTKGTKCSAITLYLDDFGPAFNGLYQLDNFTNLTTLCLARPAIGQAYGHNYRFCDWFGTTYRSGTTSYTGADFTCYVPNSLKTLICTRMDDVTTNTMYGGGSLTEFRVEDYYYNRPYDIDDFPSDFSSNCPNLTSLYVYFAGSGTCSIPKQAFMEHPKLNKIELYGNRISVGWDAFIRCYQLTRATLNGVTTIEQGGLNGCYRLSTLSFGSNNYLTKIGQYAFENCSALRTVSIPSSVKQIGAGAFANSGITSLTLGYTSGWSSNTSGYVENAFPSTGWSYYGTISGTASTLASNFKSYDSWGGRWWKRN